MPRLVSRSPSITTPSGHLVGHRPGALEVEGAGDAARQEDEGVVGQVGGGQEGVAAESDAVGAGDLDVVAHGEHVDGYPGAVEQVDDGQRLDLLQPLGDEYGHLGVGGEMIRGGHGSSFFEQHAVFALDLSPLGPGRRGPAAGAPVVG